MERINRWAMAERLPDAVVFLDLDPDQARRRLSRSLDRFEREGDEFHRAVHAGYHRMARNDPERWIVVDAGLGIDDIEAEIWARLAPRLER